MANIEVESPNISYGDRYIEADYDYCTTHVEPVNGKLKVSPFFLFFFLSSSSSSYFHSETSEIFQNARRPAKLPPRSTHCGSFGFCNLVQGH